MSTFSLAGQSCLLKYGGGFTPSCPVSHDDAALAVAMYMDGCLSYNNTMAVIVAYFGGYCIA